MKQKDTAALRRELEKLLEEGDISSQAQNFIRLLLYMDDVNLERIRDIVLAAFVSER